MWVVGVAAVKMEVREREGVGDHGVRSGGRGLREVDGGAVRVMKKEWATALKEACVAGWRG